MKIGIVGAGAMGSVYGGLFAAGHETWMVDVWAAHIEAIRDAGLRVSGASGDRTARPDATTDPSEAGVCDLVVLATKMGDLETATRAAAPMIGPGSAVLAIQNGLGNADIVGRVLGGRDFLIGIVGGFGASIPAPATSITTAGRKSTSPRRRAARALASSASSRRGAPPASPPMPTTIPTAWCGAS